MRIVSLVPSATESLIALGVRPIACTRFCEQPGVPTVGGTKDPDVERIVALRPDLVVVNDEENRREDADALADAGVSLHSMSPRSVYEVGAALRGLGAVIGVEVHDPVMPPAAPLRGTAVAMIWRRPWMTQRRDTYGSSILERLGYANPFADAAERYPVVALKEIATLAPELVVLPSEPYPFRAHHVPEIGAAVGSARVELVDGRDLFWWGTRTVHALERLKDRLAFPPGSGG